MAGRSGASGEVMAGSTDHLLTAALALAGTSVCAVHCRESLLDWECFLMFVSFLESETELLSTCRDAQHAIFQGEGSGV
ncbi:uncharacterized protein N7506_005545 [Penicillium brevicompactum]|uniref:uncharacterized protein n=1 Tax=Penicillium brevicompactum TaxID=5074 RepID=UPI00254256DF|nr:uncharacterized protein N7506_005545 [Penicillium brevicompactum]KAJ5337523.1 hypothetical protein N7506_005545 [Penicillium brevicompactum]